MINCKVSYFFDGRKYADPAVQEFIDVKATPRTLTLTVASGSNLARLRVGMLLANFTVSYEPIEREDTRTLVRPEPWIAALVVVRENKDMMVGTHYFQVAEVTEG